MKQFKYDVNIKVLSIQTIVKWRFMGEGTPKY